MNTARKRTVPAALKLLPPAALKLLAPVALLISTLFATSTFAQSTYISVGKAKTKQAVVAIMPSTTAGAMATAYAAQIQKTIEADINFLELFKILSPAGFPQGNILDTDAVKYSEWSKTGTDYLTLSALTLETASRISLTFHVMSISGNKEVLAKRYTADPSDLKTLGHAIADDLVLAITGKKGIFQTRIAFVCDKTGKKEIYTMGFDGNDVRQVTKFRSLSMAPTWSPDGTKLAFSIFNRHSDNVRNIDLYEINFKTGKVQPLSNKPGINSGAHYHPDGRSLILTMSFSGNPELYTMDLETKRATQLTKSIGFDVDPRYSPDGRKIAFTSSRAGKPMIYVMPTSDPSAAKRLTYAGQYNATPTWLPDGKHLIFAGWLEGHFDLFRMNLENDGIDRLTKDEGNNEDPSASPDGNFLVFSSNRAGGNNIWIMSTDAKFAKRLTFGMGGCVAAQWSPYL